MAPPLQHSAAVENLGFLTAELASQIENLQGFFETGSVTIAQRILDRAGYVYNLKLRIENDCLSRLSNERSPEQQALLRALHGIASDLERIAELARDAIHQCGYMRRHKRLQPKRYRKLLGRVQKGVRLIEPALLQGDTRRALRIGKIERQLDRGYQRLVRRYSKALKKRHGDDLIDALRVAHCVEAMGDALLDVSEAIISANLGQPIRTDRYHSLRASMAQLENSDRLQLETVAETRSGSAIAGISDGKPGADGYVAIFKDGVKKKVREERHGVKNWHAIYPGLAPRILAYQKRGESASLLIEHLAGQTFEQILLREGDPLLKQAGKQLTQTLAAVWDETRSKTPVAAGFMRQLRKRLEDVYAIHPEFRRGPQRIGGCSLDGFEQLLLRAEKIEQRLSAPFSVYIHGDFNVDNILYDPLERRINFIDLHRSRHMDYVQDVSVFMVSNYRLQVLDAPLRRRILDTACRIYRFASDYAARQGDDGFELRLALGLARSFATSTRFILDKSQSRAMFLRARYLIERVLAADIERPQDFKLPIREIFVG